MVATESVDLDVRSARTDDRPAILEVVRRAFTSDAANGEDEVGIVEAIWAAQRSADGLDLVGTAGGAVVGHVLGSWGTLGGDPIVGIAPLAVAPPRQGAGVGTALIEEFLRRADSAELPLVVLLGDEHYYRRFGFEPAAPLHITYEPAGRDSPHFQVRRLSAYKPGFSGTYVYAWERPTSG